MAAMPGTLPDLLDQLAATLERDAAQSADQGRIKRSRLYAGGCCRQSGTCTSVRILPSAGCSVGTDLAATLLLGEETEPTEGLVLFQEGERLVLQVFDAIGEVVPRHAGAGLQRIGSDDQPSVGGNEQGRCRIR